MSRNPTPKKSERSERKRRDDIPVADIARALNRDPDRWAPVIIGEQPNKAMSSARELRFYKNGALRVHLTGPRRGKFTRFGDNAYGDMLELIAFINDCSKGEAVIIAKGLLGISADTDFVPPPPRPAADIEKEAREEEAKRIRTARFICSRTSAEIGVNGIGYLKSRGIELKTIPAAMRFRHLDAEALERMEISPSLFPNGLDCLAFRATDEKGTAAVQQILLDGPAKAGIENVKRTNGSLLSGAAVKFALPSETAFPDTLILAEGPETGLSCWISTEIATWVVMGVGNYTRVAIPDTVRRIIIAVDLEESRQGLVQAIRSAVYWMVRGRQVLLAIPSIESDMNDVLQRYGTEGVREDIANAIAPARNPYMSNGELRADALSRAPAILLEDADDALAIWQATGLPAIATVGKIKRYVSRYLPEGCGKALVILGPEDEAPAQEEEIADLRTLRLVTPLRGLIETKGLEVISEILRLGAPRGRRQLYRIEDLTGQPVEKPVFVASNRRIGAAMKRLYPGYPVVVMTSCSDIPYDLAPLSGRRIVQVADASCAAETAAIRDVAQKLATIAIDGDLASLTRAQVNQLIAAASGAKKPAARASQRRKAA